MATSGVAIQEIHAPFALTHRPVTCATEGNRAMRPRPVWMLARVTLIAEYTGVAREWL